VLHIVILELVQNRCKFKRRVFSSLIIVGPIVFFFYLAKVYLFLVKIFFISLYPLVRFI
jgi:hypothetical protein